MKRVLIVAYYFPPIATSGSLRPLGFCRYLEQYGWLPRVLSTEPGSIYPSVEVDENLCSRLPNRLRVDRVPHVNPLQDLILTREKILKKAKWIFGSLEKPRMVRNNQPRREDQKRREGFARFKNFISDRLSFPDPQRFWLCTASRWLSKLPSSECPDIVFATGGPWTSLLVGQMLAQKFKVPFVADFRDPWTNNPFQRFRSSPLLLRTQRLERAVCTAAARVVANTAELCAQFVADYPDLKEKFLTITNGFDAENCGLVDTTVDTQRNMPPSANGQLELCHFGAVYGNRNPVSLFQAIKELYDDGGIRPGQLRLRFVGSWKVEDNSCEVFAQELERQGVLRRDPPVPHNVCLQQMAAAPTLLILQPAFPLQIPGKIYEYIATGRPLFVVGGEGATAHLVEQHRLGRCCANDVAEIKQLLGNLISAQTTMDPPQPTERGRFDYRTLTGELAAVFDRVCQGQQPSAS